MKTAIPKILHLYWGKDKPLSWLRWLTVKTFSMLNPDWQIIVWYPKTPGLHPNWATKEHAQYAWKGKNWFDKLPEAGLNVQLRPAPIDDFPAMTEVHRSDLLRWRLLHTHGGFWSDFDIIYFRPMSVLGLDMGADALLCWGETKELSQWQAIGFLAGRKGCQMFQDMEAAGLELARDGNLNYQDLGTDLLLRFAPAGCHQADQTKIAQIPMASVYPFKSVGSQHMALWHNRKFLDIKDNTIGLHWFAAQPNSCRIEASWSGSAIVNKDAHCGGVRWALSETGLVAPPAIPVIKYSIIIPYLDRSQLLYNTLLSFSKWYSDRNDLEIIVVRDSKCQEPQALDSVVRWAWKKLSLDIVILEQNNDAGYTPSRLYNQGVAQAKGQYIMLTSPEILHQVDVLAGLDSEFDKTPGAYVVCACRNFKVRSPKAKVFEQIQGRPNNWYQHSQNRPAGYHFCSALSKELYQSVGGFDEAFAGGFCFDDDDFRDSLLEAGVKLVQRDDLLTYHQMHEHVNVPDKITLWNKNKALYEVKHGAYKPLALGSSALGSASVAVLCVLKSGGDFTVDYVQNLKSMVERNLLVKHEFVCLTDIKEIDFCKTIGLERDFPGWWSKVELFRPRLVDADRIIYFDLDTIILSNIDLLSSLTGDFYALQPWNVFNRQQGYCGSGMMNWRNGMFDFLYQNFRPAAISDLHGGDQEYISRSLDARGFRFIPIQNILPGVKSYKRECRRGLPADARVICFHGRPRVHECQDKWVKEAWR